MTLRSRPGRWWRRLAGSASAAMLAFGLLAGACVLVAVAGPRSAALLRTTAYHQLVRQTRPAELDLIGTTDAGTLSAGLLHGVGSDDLSAAQAQLSQQLTRLPLGRPSAQWNGLATPPEPVSDTFSGVSTGAPARLELMYRSAFAGYVRVVSGSLPVAEPARDGPGALEAAVTVPTARRFGLHAGSVVRMPGAGIVLRISGIVQQRDRAAPWWSLDPLEETPQLVMPGGGSPYWQGAVFLAPVAVADLQHDLAPAQIQLTWLLPLNLGRLTAAQALGIQVPLNAATLNGGTVIVDPDRIPAPIALGSGAAGLLSAFASQSAAVDRVLDLLAVSLAVVAIAVIFLVAWLLAERRREEFAVLRARGASRGQLALLMSTGCVLAAGPAAVVAAVLVVTVLPGSPAPLGWWLAGGVLLAAAGGPAAIILTVYRKDAVTAGRPDRAPGRIPVMRRLVAEAGLSLAAVGGLVVLREQGLGRGSGDLYAAAAPVLVAIPAALLLLRLYPLAIRGLLRALGDRAGATTFVGLARASRVSPAVVVPAFAMVLALGLASFAGMVQSAVARGEVTASWQATGADAAIVASVPPSAAQQRQIAAVPGVRAIASLGLATASYGNGNSVTIALVDPAQYRALLARSPLPQPPAQFGTGRAGGRTPVPVLASPGLAAFGSRPVSLTLDGQQITVVADGAAPAMSGIGPIGSAGSGGCLVLPSSAVAGPPPAAGVLLVDGSGLHATALAAAARRAMHSSVVDFRSAALSALQAAPLQHDTYLALAVGGYAAAAACLLLLLLSLLMSASARELTLARMSTMGLSDGQSRRLALAETLPLVLAVLAGGLACGLALAPLVGPTLNLAVFTGSNASVPVQAEPRWLLTAGGGLLVVILVTLTAQVLVASRNAPRSVRIGG
jgi:putative ABC transport system permease protein